MNIFGLNFPEENKKDKFPELEKWFDFMNDQLEGLEKNHEKREINNLLIDNDIETVD
tara:strand:- start:57 stop:227 length:171 start_codon:yes stop_codon:yes gene_type:complete